MTIGHVSDEVLSAWLEHDLADEERGQLDDHLRDCERCRRSLLAIREVIQGAGAAPAAWHGKAMVWDSISRRLGEPTNRRQPEARPSRPVWLVGAIAAAAVVATVLLVWRPLARPATKADSPPVAALLALDREVNRELEALVNRPDWATASTRQALLAANREIGGGIETLARALRERPADPALVQLLAHAVEHRAGLIREVSQ